MKKIDELPKDVRRIVIAGHIHPDGDCVGSCLGLKNYLAVIRPEAQVDVYLEKFSEDFIFLQGAGDVCHGAPRGGTLRGRIRAGLQRYGASGGMR